MRDIEFCSCDHDVVVQENVDVDGPWTFRRLALAVHLTFNFLNPSQQLYRKKPGLYFDHLIQEPCLAAHVLRLGFVDGRTPQNSQIGGVQPFDGFDQVSLPVADVRA